MEEKYNNPNWCHGCDQIHNYKLDNTLGEANWVGCKMNFTEKNKELIENMDKIEIHWASGNIDHDSYSYDEYAVIKFKNEWYLSNTSGCSCPADYETWNIAFGPTTLNKIIKYFKNGEYNDYSINETSLAKIISELEEVKENENKKHRQ